MRFDFQHSKHSRDMDPLFTLIGNLLSHSFCSSLIRKRNFEMKIYKYDCSSFKSNSTKKAKNSKTNIKSSLNFKSMSPNICLRCITISLRFIWQMWINCIEYRQNRVLTLTAQDTATLRAEFDTKRKELENKIQMLERELENEQQLRKSLEVEVKLIKHYYCTE
jgi:hypothetical protein